jgi:hypothetical protein
MRDRYVVDTNVLIAASAADPLHPKDIDATPSDPELRRQVWEWLRQFRESSARLVLDQQQEIYKEYRNKLNGNDYGLQVVIHKLSTCATDIVSVAYDADGNARVPAPLEAVVHDLADRKLVAACLESLRLHQPCLIAFAGDTDWHDWEAALRAYGVELEPIIEAWSRQRHAEKQHR